MDKTLNLGWGVWDFTPSLGSRQFYTPLDSMDPMGWCKSHTLLQQGMYCEGVLLAIPGYPGSPSVVDIILSQWLLLA